MPSCEAVNDEVTRGSTDACRPRDAQIDELSDTLVDCLQTSGRNATWRVAAPSHSAVTPRGHFRIHNAVDAVANATDAPRSRRKPQT